jgi:hypothetical protein
MSQIIPVCINMGCNNLVRVRHVLKSGNYSVRNECYICWKNRRAGITLNNIIYIKKGICENQLCPVMKTFQFTSDLLHIDHINGNNRDNDPNNIQTLCSICHSMKGFNNNDFTNNKIYTDNI